MRSWDEVGWFILVSLHYRYANRPRDMHSLHIDNEFRLSENLINHARL